MLQSIEQEWNEFAEAVIPSVSKTSVQYTEMRKAFLAGAIVIHVAFIELASAGASEETGSQWLRRLSDDLMNFKSKIVQEMASRN